MSSKCRSFIVWAYTTSGENWFYIIRIKHIERMVRRRSSLAQIIFQISDLKLFNRIKRRKIFRSSVKFKKYRFKGTKFKRRHIRKLKHKATWALYYNVLNYWTDDIRIVRQYARFQYHYRFFVHNSIITHRTVWAARRNRFFITQDQWLSASITRRLFLTVGNLNNVNVLKSQMTNHHALAFYPDDFMNPDAATTPFLSLFDKQLFVENREQDQSNFDIFITDFIGHIIMFQELTEFYKILIFFWYLTVLKLNYNVHKT